MLSATVLPCTAVRAWHRARLGFQIPRRCPGHLSPFPGALRAEGCTKPDAHGTKQNLGRTASTSKANACHADLHGGEHVPQVLASAQQRRGSEPHCVAIQQETSRVLTRRPFCGPTIRHAGGTPPTQIRRPKPISLFYKQSARTPTTTGASWARRRRKSDRRNPSHCSTNKVPGNPQLPEHRGHAADENGNQKLPDATKLCWKRARQVVLQCRQTQPVSHELDRCACA